MPASISCNPFSTYAVLPMSSASGVRYDNVIISGQGNTIGIETRTAGIPLEQTLNISFMVAFLHTEP
eukprot:m51a1_g10601 hypothetical protein (67) ;mRNA; r:35683-35883